MQDLVAPEPRSIQREEEERTDPFEIVSKTLEGKDQAETISTAFSQAEGQASDELSATEAANSGFFGPVGMGLGLKSLTEGLHEGGEKGARKAVSGGLGTLSGATTMLAPALGKAAAPLSTGLGGLGMGYSLGNEGVGESPYDLPGTAADIGEWAHEHIPIPGAGAVGTLVGSAAMVPAAAAYGVKKEVSGLGIAGAASQFAKAEAPVIDIPTTETLEPDDRQIAYEH